MLRYPTVDGDVKCLDTSEATCRRLFGFASGECIRTTKGDVEVLGECNGMLYLRRSRISDGGHSSAHIAMKRTTSRIPPLAAAGLLRGTVAYPWSRKAVRDLRVTMSSAGAAKRGGADATTVSAATAGWSPANGGAILEPSSSTKTLLTWWQSATGLGLDDHLMRVLNQLATQSCDIANDETGVSRRLPSRVMMLDSAMSSSAAGSGEPGDGIADASAVPSALSSASSASARASVSSTSSSADSSASVSASAVGVSSASSAAAAVAIAAAAAAADSSAGTVGAVGGGGLPSTWNVHPEIVRRALAADGPLLQACGGSIAGLETIMPRLMARTALILYLNHVLEPVLTFVELWQDGMSASASGWTPTLSRGAAIRGISPRPWQLGAELLRSKRFLLTTTKKRLLCIFMARTASQGIESVSLPNTSATNISSSSSSSLKDSSRSGSGKNGEGESSSNGRKSSMNHSAAAGDVLSVTTERPLINIALQSSNTVWGMSTDVTTAFGNTEKAFGGERKSSSGAVESAGTSKFADSKAGSLRKWMASSAASGIVRAAADVESGWQGKKTGLSPQPTRLAWHASLDDSVFGQCAACLRSQSKRNPASLRHGDGLSSSTFTLQVLFQNDPVLSSSGNLSPPSVITSASTPTSANLSAEEGRNGQRRLFALVSEEVVYPLRLFDAIFADGDRRTVLVPSARNSVAGCNAELYRSIGNLIGISLRTNVPLDLPLAPLIWLLIVDPSSDLFASVQSDDAVPADDDEAVSVVPEELAVLDHGGALGILCDPARRARHTTEIEEVFGCPAREVPQRVAGVLKKRLHTIRGAIEQIREGLLEVVPGHTLTLFSWDELDAALTGRGR